MGLLNNKQGNNINLDDISFCEKCGVTYNIEYTKFEIKGKDKLYICPLCKSKNLHIEEKK